MGLTFLGLLKRVWKHLSAPAYVSASVSAYRPIPCRNSHSKLIRKDSSLAWILAINLSLFRIPGEEFVFLSSPTGLLILLVFVPPFFSFCSEKKTSVPDSTCALSSPYFFLYLTRRTLLARMRECPLRKRGNFPIGELAI